MRSLAVLAVLAALTCAGFAQETAPVRASCPSTLGDARVLFVGDVHSDPVIKEDLASLLPCLKGLGVTHLTLEMLRDTESIRDALEEYSRTGQNEARVFRFLRSDWHWMPELYLDVMRVARNAGVKVLAMDAPSRSGHDVRERHMAQVMTSVLAADPRARILVLVGVYHARPEGLPALLAAAGLSSSILSTSRTAE